MRNILLTTYYLDFSGSSTFLQTLALFLRKIGFRVTIFAIVVKPEVREILLRKKIRVTSDLEDVKKDTIHYIVAQHNIPAMFARHFFPTTPLIYTSHGVLSSQEDPPSVDIGISHFIAISEEVKKKLVSKDKINPDDITVIRNFIDTNRFKINKPIGNKAKKVLLLSSRYTKEVLDTVKRACSVLKLKLTLLGKGKRKYRVEDYINDADIVISLGRGVLESMSCGRPALIYDYKGGDGMVSKRNYTRIMQRNFSGRTGKNRYSAQALVAELEKYDATSSNDLRSIVCEHFNVEKSGQKIVDILKSLKPLKDSSKYPLPYREIKWLINEINNLFAKKA